MFDDEKGYYEIQLDNKWLIIIFIIFVVILGMVFVWGMKVGRDTTELEYGMQGKEKTSSEENPKFAEQDLTGTGEEQRWGNTEKKEGIESYDLKTELIGNDKPSKETAPIKSQDTKAAQNKETLNQSDSQSKKKPSTTTDQSKSPDLKDGPYIVQILSIKDKEKAEYYTKILKEEGYPSSMTIVELGTQGYFYRVRVGGYQTRNEAQDQINRILAEEKLQPILKGKKNLLIIKQY